MSDARTAVLATTLVAVTERIERACATAGRDPASVCLVAVTKTFPVDDVARLAALGVREVAENTDQEARAKHAAYAERGPAEAGVPRLRWHFVGRLQTNKARSVATYADVVQTVDRPGLVAALAAGADRSARDLDVLLQVSLDGDRARGGADPAEIPALAAAVATAGRLRLAGVMAVAPLRGDPREAFDRLARVGERLRVEHPGATWLSAGMSGDLEAAVAAGATHLRIGTALLGGRPLAVR